jgi:uncharacterized protein
MTSRRWLLVGLAGAALLLLAGRALASLYVDYEWYRALGALAVWRMKTGLNLLLRGLTATIGGLFIFGNLYAVRHSVISLVLPRRVANLEIGEEVPGRYLMFAVGGLSVLFGALLTLPYDNWAALALAEGGVPFGEEDPTFHLDLGYFVYWLPFERSLYLWAVIALLLGAALVIFLYALTPSLRWERGSLYVSGYVRRHLAVLVALGLCLLAWHFRLDAYAVLSDGSGPGGAFTFLDHRLTIPASLVLALATFSTALVVLWAGWTGQVRVALGAVVALFVVWLLLRQLAPLFVGRFASVENPEKRELQYTVMRASYTRPAYGVDTTRIAVMDSVVGFPTLAAATPGVPIWDAIALRRAIERSRGEVTVSGAIGWQPSANGLMGFAVERPPEAERSRGLPAWSIARALAWTTDLHGGLQRVDARGAPTTDDAPIDPVLVFDSAGAYTIVADSMSAIVGTTLGSGLSRLAHAWSLQNFRLLAEDLPKPRPVIVLRRNVPERLEALAPFFTQGRSIAPVWVSDSLYWVVDLYSTSDSYPLSQPFVSDNVRYRYFQHAATAMIQAHSGRVTLVADQTLDPIARTWVRIFPSLFEPWSALPEGFRDRLPPIEEGTLAQATALASFGFRHESWTPPRHVATEFGADTALATLPPPPIALGAGAAATLQRVIPVLDETETVRGLVLARGGAARRALWAPLRRSAPRWTAIVDDLRRPADSTSTRDGLPVRGPVKAVPISGNLAFVQSVYGWNRQGGAPSMLRVNVIVGDTARTGRTLADIVGVVAGRGPSPVPPQDFRGRVEALYDAMRAALERGDLRAFGDAYNALGELLGRAPR